MRNPFPLLHDITRGIAYGARKRSPWYMWMLIQDGTARWRRQPGPYRVRVGSGVLWTPSFGQALFLTKEIFLEGSYRMSLPDRPVILDCGANIGASLLYFSRTFAGARLIAFEPDPGAIELLERTVRDNGMTVELHQVALGRQEGVATIRAETLASMHATVRGGPAEGARVKVVPLSGYLPTEGVDLLKLDVEGSELDVLEELRDARALSRVRALIVEVHPELGVTTEAVRTLLEEAGLAVGGERLLCCTRRRD